MTASISSVGLEGLDGSMQAEWYTTCSNTDMARILTGPPSPAERARSTLERAHHVRGDPAAVERALVGFDDLDVDRAPVHLLGVERVVADQVAEPLGGLRVRPHRRLGHGVPGVEDRKSTRLNYSH